VNQQSDEGRLALVVTFQGRLAAHFGHDKLHPLVDFQSRWYPVTQLCMSKTPDPSLDPTQPTTPQEVQDEACQEAPFHDLNEPSCGQLDQVFEDSAQSVELEPAEIVPTERASEAEVCTPTKRYPAEITPSSSAPIVPTRLTAESPMQRQVSWSVFLIGQSLILLVVIGGIIWLDQGREKGAPAPVIVQSPAAQESSAPPQGEEFSALKVSLSRAQEQITALQRQIDAQNADRTGTQARLQEMADRMALVIKQSSFVPSSDAQNLGSGDAAQVAAMLPSVSPATSELILLKERNRLTDYADKAISTGARESLQAIVEAMFDPALKHLRHAAEAEFRRVQAYFEISSSIDPAYKLPLQELFKEAPVRAEADLTPGQLTTLLNDGKQPWEVRLRCAYLLRASTDAGTNAALLKVIKDDPSLDVAKQAQTTFEKRVGQRFRLFDIPSIEAWWEAQKPK
jgi:hypothetical protein